MITEQVTRDVLRRVALVMVTFESEATVREGLDPLPLDQLAAAVVIDNASSDQSAAIARDAGATVLVRSTNSGFGAAVDEGLTMAKPSEYALVLNPDAAIATQDLVTLVAHLDAHPRCGMVAPRLYRAGAPLRSAGRQATLATELRLVAPRVLARRLPDRRYAETYAQTGPAGYVEGACVLVRRAAVEHVGGFGPGWFLFYEELDLARRLRRAKLTADLCAEARAEHRVAVSRAATPLAGRPLLFGAARAYLERWHGPAAAAAFRVVANSTWWVQQRRGLLTDDERRLLRAGVRGPRG
jgi:N-acetylglucosaminyl-diphospho-decaprenol L-rhamnosyltransferase